MQAEKSQTCADAPLQLGPRTAQFGAKLGTANLNEQQLPRIFLHHEWRDIAQLVGAA
jgi:hypothetical protein